MPYTAPIQYSNVEVDHLSKNRFGMCVHTYHQSAHSENRKISNGNVFY